MKFLVLLSNTQTYQMCPKILFLMLPLQIDSLFKQSTRIFRRRTFLLPDPVHCPSTHPYALTSGCCMYTKKITVPGIPECDGEDFPCQKHLLMSAAIRMESSRLMPARWSSKNARAQRHQTTKVRARRVFIFCFNHKHTGLFFQSCWPTRDHIGRSTGISNPAWHLPQVVPKVDQTTGSVHPQPTLPNC